MDFSTQTNKFIGVIDNDGTIYEYSQGRKNQVIGYDSQFVKEIQTENAEVKEVLDNYYNKLVELGEIVPEKTAEEIAKEAAEKQLSEQTEINKELMSALADIKAELKELKSDKKKTKGAAKDD